MRTCVKVLALAGLLAGVLLPGAFSPAAEYSALWGREGEVWTPQGRLPDFSFAGCHCGEEPIPTVPLCLDERSGRAGTV